MLATPISKVLRQLETAAPANLELQSQPRSELEKCGQCRTETEFQRELEEARRRGFADGFEAAKLDVVQSERVHAERLSSEQRANFNKLANDALSRISDGLERMQTDVAVSAAETLREFFREKIKQEAIDSVALELSRLLELKPVTRLIVSGPQAWIDVVTPILEGAGITDYDLRLKESLDVSIEWDQTRLETRVGGWIESLRTLP